jgi:hypothetical protein
VLDSRNQIPLKDGCLANLAFSFRSISALLDRRQLLLPVALTHLDCYSPGGRCLTRLATEKWQQTGGTTMGARIDVKTKRELVKVVSER